MGIEILQGIENKKPGAIVTDLANSNKINLR